ncbi:hypothetical protein [Streptomyces massasporeus]|uniref:hypothetical protein n=1 Tax=Streptomyces massasporeus TaxID=67324 RepID=UPI0016743219|nr:hypothetical protein [Streptomyces massasporeus]
MAAPTLFSTAGEGGVPAGVADRLPQVLPVLAAEAPERGPGRAVLAQQLQRGRKRVLLDDLLDLSRQQGAAIAGVLAAAVQSEIDRGMPTANAEPLRWRWAYRGPHLTRTQRHARLPEHLAVRLHVAG